MKMKMINLEGKNVGEKRRRIKPHQIAIGLVALILVPTIGNTFAGAIAINSSSNVEFGQGSTITAACDSQMTVTPEAIYTSAGNFYLESITVTNIGFTDSVTAGAACLNKTFKIYVANSSNALQDWVASNTKYVSFLVPNSGTTVTGLSPASGVTVSMSGSGTTSGSLSIVLATPYLLASSTEKILIQTQ